MTVKRPRRPLAEVRTITAVVEESHQVTQYKEGDVICLEHDLKLYGPNRTLPAGTELLVTQVRPHSVHCYHVRTSGGEELACTPVEVRPIGPAPAVTGDKVVFVATKNNAWVEGDYGTVLAHEDVTNWFPGLTWDDRKAIPGLIIEHETGRNYTVNYSEVRKR